MEIMQRQPNAFIGYGKDINIMLQQVYLDITIMKGLACNVILGKVFISPSWR